MSSELEAAYYTLRKYTKTDQEQSALGCLYNLIKLSNEYTITAHIPISDIELEYRDLDELQDYWVVSGSYETLDYAYTQEERDSKLEELQEIIERIENLYSHLDARDLPLGSAYLSCLHALDEKLDELQEKLSDLECANWREDELICDSVFTIGWRDVDLDIAAQVGLGVVRDGNDRDWLFHTSYGSDCRPKITAYAALKYGAIPEGHLRFFEDLRWFRDIVSRSVLEAVLLALDLSPLQVQYFLGKR